MKKLVLVVLVAICSSIGFANPVSAINDNLKGSWQYKVPSAPYEYSSGQIIIAEQEGKMAITVNFSDGSQLKGQDVKIEDNSFSFTVLIESETIKVSGKLENGKINGKVDSSQGIMNFTAEQVKR